MEDQRLETASAGGGSASLLLQGVPLVTECPLTGLQQLAAMLINWAIRGVRWPPLFSVPGRVLGRCSHPAACASQDPSPFPLLLESSRASVRQMGR